MDETDMCLGTRSAHFSLCCGHTQVSTPHFHLGRDAARKVTRLKGIPAWPITYVRALLERT